MGCPVPCSELPGLFKFGVKVHSVREDVLSLRHYQTFLHLTFAYAILAIHKFDLRSGFEEGIASSLGFCVIQKPGSDLEIET